MKGGAIDFCKTLLQNPTMKIGYARISTDEQSLDLQRDALVKAGCADVFEDRGVSGVAAQRPGLEAALARIQASDVLVVWKLDRLGRSLPHLIETVRQLGALGAGFASLSESIDTTTAGGKLVFHIMGALAEFERTLIVERVSAGIAAAKKRGKHIGRPRKLSAEQIAHARDAIDGGLQTRAGMAAVLGVDHSTLWRAMRVASDVLPSSVPESRPRHPQMIDGGHNGRH
jgi:DNA invertase Pin-like site-specific DNA recombinase